MDAYGSIGYHPKPKQITTKSTWEDLPRSPEINKLRRDLESDKIDVVSFLLKTEDLFKQRVDEINDWQDVNAWSDPLEPVAKPKPSTKVAKRKGPEPKTGMDFARYLYEHDGNHHHKCTCYECQVLRMQKKLASARAVPPHVMGPPTYKNKCPKCGGYGHYHQRSYETRKDPWADRYYVVSNHWCTFCGHQAQEIIPSEVTPSGALALLD